MGVEEAKRCGAPVIIDSHEFKSARGPAIRAFLFSHKIAYSVEKIAVDMDFDLALVENKEPADFVQSCVSGHLQEQIVRIQETTRPGIILVWGNYEDVVIAIRRSTLEENYAFSRIFECMGYAWANCVPVWMLGKTPLDTAYAIMQSTELMPMPKPAKNARQALALAMLCDGIGIKKARAILRMYPFKTLWEHTPEDFQKVEGIGEVLSYKLYRALGGKR